MHAADWTVLFLYLGGTVFLGIFLGRLVKSASDLFSAGGQSPWWASGLSAFMTMFSANTFVVWGSIAFDLGFVAVTINLMYGVAALLAGYFVASRWKRLGVETPAQYVQVRFGTGALHFYTWSMMLVRVVGTAGALYALGKILVALMPLAEGNPLRDPETGNLSLQWAIMIFGSAVVLYTMVGGLWAVLMTDVVQFIILNLAVLFVVPLALQDVGGVSGFVEGAPDDFFALTGGKYTWFFLIGWCMIHFFMIGAEWAFVQRFLCVPDQKSARKSTYLFGILYLVSPLLWLLPPMIHRISDPTADPEQAYILSCKSVLPIGMVGLMLAAMFSATASMVSSQLNVFSGVLTNDIYKPLAKHTDGGTLVRVGRIFTVILGGVLIWIALQIQGWGQVKDVIIGISEMMVTALLAPSLWGLFSKSIRGRAVWITGLIGVSVGVLVRFGFGQDAFGEGKDGFLTGVDSLAVLRDWLQANANVMKTFTGVFLPVLILTVIQLCSKGEAPGYKALAALATREEEREARGVVASPIPALVVGWSLLVCGLSVGLLIFVNDEKRGVLLLFGAVLLVLGGLILRKGRQQISEN